MTSVIHTLQSGETCQERCGADEHYTHTTSLFDGDLWQTLERQALRVHEMTPRHALNTYEFLHRRAWKYAWDESMAMFTGPFAPSGDMAVDACEQIADRMLDFPHEWIDTRPLVRALWLRALDGIDA